MTATPREFDIVLYGATGFVGKLTAEYLARAGAGARIALAGRSPDRLLAVRDTIPQTDPLAKAEFATIRERLIKIGARVIEHIARIRVKLPSSCPERALFRTVALGLMPSGP